MSAPRDLANADAGKDEGVHMDDAASSSAVQATGLNPATVPAVLRAAADLIEPEGKWTQNWWARRANGTICEPIDPAAACWCLRGAVNRVVRGEGATGDVTRLPPIQTDAERFIGEATPMRRASNGEYDTSGFNDAPERTQAEVVAALRKAADLAEAEASQ